MRLEEDIEMRRVKEEAALAENTRLSAELALEEAARKAAREQRLEEERQLRIFQEEERAKRAKEEDSTSAYAQASA